MNQMQILDRLVSIRNNALNRSEDRYGEMTDLDRCRIKAMLLEQGINQLIMEIQNMMLRKYQLEENTEKKQR